MDIDNIRSILPEFLYNPPVTLNQSREEVQELFDRLCLLIFNDERDKAYHYVLTEEEYGILKDIGFNNISDFSGRYSDLTGLPDIPEKVTDLEDADKYATKDYIAAFIGDPIPRKLSQLYNDMGFITSEAIPEIPTRLSELENDPGFITGDKLDELFNGIPEVDESGNTVYVGGIFPNNLSAFTNDVGYARDCDTIQYKRLSEVEISFGTEEFEETLLKLAKSELENHAPNIIYRGVCYNQEILNLFATRSINDCYIEVRTIEHTELKIVYEITVTSIGSQPYRFVRLYEIKINGEDLSINNRSPYWYTTINMITEEDIRNIVVDVLKEHKLI